MSNTRKSGFTLIEIMVVLGLVAIITSITFGAFRSISDGNKRTSCQSNLSQIYQSCRLYAQDYNGKFPYLNAGGAPSQANTPSGGIGLWALYAFPTATSNLCTPNITDYNVDLNLPLASEDGTQVTGYVRNTKIFHCPADRFSKEIRLPSSCGTPIAVPTASLTIVSGTNTYLNPSFLSYQTVDDTGSTPRDTYSSFRASDHLTPGTPNHQLIPFTTVSGVTITPERPTIDKTIVTWCRNHRRLDNNGNTQMGRRNYDNVLFYDGTVQSIPIKADKETAQPCDPVGGNCVEGWQREPKKPQ